MLQRHQRHSRMPVEARLYDPDGGGLLGIPRGKPAYVRLQQQAAELAAGFSCFLAQKATTLLEQMRKLYSCSRSHPSKEGFRNSLLQL